MKKIIPVLALIACCLVQACQKENLARVSDHRYDETTAEANNKTILDTVPVIAQDTPKWITRFGVQYVKCYFQATTANYYQNTIYMHVKINGSWNYDLLPVIWNNPIATYQLPTNLSPGTYEVYYSTRPMDESGGQNSAVYTITVS